MKPDCWQQLNELFDVALARTPRDHAAFLDEACARGEWSRK